MNESWDELAEGKNCPFDAPLTEDNEHAHFVRKLSVSTLYLQRNQPYSGHCVLIYDMNHRIRMDQLTRDEWLAYAADLHVSESAIYKALRPDHINVGSYGNMVPHLHWHIVPRYKDDGRWGAPIWTTIPAEMPSKMLSLDKLRLLAESIDREIENAL